MAGFGVPPVVFLGIDAVELSHTSGQIGIGGLDHEMIMIVHEAVCVAKPIIPFNDNAKDSKKILSVLIISEYPVSCIAPRGDVINRIRIFYS